jgi:site-specific recombinase XerD
MQEVQQVFDSADSLRDKTMLMTIYGGGLRVSEIVNLKTTDIYASSMRILIRQGKGRRDRLTLLSKTNLDILTKYLYAYKPNHPKHYLFLNRSKNRMTTRVAADIFRKALSNSGVQKPASIHTLRHCFATHLLESGAYLCQIKKLLGHTHIQTTSRYLHLSNLENSLISPLDSMFFKSGVQ